MPNRELSDLSMSRKECPKCGATWINGQHKWATGMEGSERDLAGLVCNNLGDNTCINPKRSRGWRYMGREIQVHWKTWRRCRFKKD